MPRRNDEVSRIRGKIFASSRAPSPPIVSTTRLTADRADDRHRAPYGSLVQISVAHVAFVGFVVPSLTQGRPAKAREFLDAWSDADDLFDAIRKARWWRSGMKEARLKVLAR